MPKPTRKIPKAQQEVWEWKQNLYEETKNMSTTEGLSYLLKKGEQFRCQKKFQTR
ncbi:hypothetical protein BGP_2937 [Beggiatoa sp. PS]|nr:hypothetical protein BGP_2937 [Beggiatoa sp. PS]